MFFLLSFLFMMLLRALACTNGFHHDEQQKVYHRRAQIAIRIRVLDHDQHDQRLEEEAITSRNIIAVDNSSSSSSSTEDEDVLAIIINSRRAVTIKRLPKCQLHRAVVAVEKERAKRRRHHRLARLAVLAVVAVVTAATVPLLRLLLLVAVVDANTHRDPVRKQQPGRRAAKRKQTPKGKLQKQKFSFFFFFFFLNSKVGLIMMTQ